MNVYKSRTQYDGSLDKLKLIIVVRGDLQNKEIIGYTWSPTASMRNLKYFLAEYSNHKARVNELAFIVSFLQANIKYSFLWSWTVDMENNYYNIATILEYHGY